MIARWHSAALLSWGVSLGVGAIAGAWSAGARVQSVTDRVSVLERDTRQVSSCHQELRQDITDQLRRVELALVELRAEQRILHERQ